MSALTDVQAAFATTLTQLDTYLGNITTLSIDTPIEIAKVASAYAKARGVIIAALPASEAAQAAAAAALLAVETVLDAVATLSVDNPINALKDAKTALDAAGVVIAALT